ncbi:MAG: hypothetical protein OQK24_02880 [Magnetovibrio sp.]|nr:hypothetical protein [Magnetovibrio sp.]
MHPLHPNRFWLAIIASLMAMTFASTVSADWKPRVLLIGEDGNPQTMARNQPQFSELIEAIADNLNESEFRIYTEKGIAKSPKRKNVKRRNIQETITALEQLPDDIVDWAVMLTVRRDVKHRADHSQFTLKIIARVIDPYEGDVLETIKVQSAKQRLENMKCDEPCLRRATNDAGHTIAPYLIDRLTEELEDLEEDMQAELGDEDYFADIDQVDSQELRNDLNG